MGELLQIKELKKYFPVRTGPLRPVAHVKAVDGVSLEMGRGETLGLVGESGCGKTTLANVVIGLEEPTDGHVYFEGKDVFAMGRTELRRMRADIQIVFQDPFWSLNPRWLVRDVVGEPIKVHTRVSRQEYQEQVEELLETVGLPKEGVFKYPHEFSGGQRQRIAIARALALHPKFVILDEPVSAIDIVSQVQILALLQDLKQEMNLSYILISHDLGVVHSLADTIAVMYLGKVVEHGPARATFEAPAHPYTQGLLEAIPRPESSIESIKTLEGEIPSAIHPPSGCRFHTRCDRATARCRREEPVAIQVGDQRTAWCWCV
jgi:oligopeptide/dipeptide ABC transporter ATP-binding protein